MAKGYRTGTMTGKIGSDVGYTLKNSKNKVQQAWRIYQPNVKNPKTQGQAAQRMKMAPAANFYRGLATILDHSWQSVPYGNNSRQFFMKLAMDSAINFRFPFVPKGEKGFIPGEYPVSRGSLAPVSVLAVTTNSFQSSLIDNGNMDLTDSFGAWCQLLIEANPTLQANDQLTFICVYKNNEGSYYPIVRRVVLDTALIGNDNSITATNILHQQGIEVYPATGTQMIFGLGRNLSQETAFEPFEDEMVAAAVIVSRKNTNGSSVVWERSNSNMAVSSAISTTWLSNTAYESALGTYMKAETNQTSDRYLNQSGNNIQTEVTIVNGQFRLGDLVNGAFAADEIYQLAVVNGNRIVGTDTVTGETHHIQLYRYIDGEFRLITSERGNTVSWNSNSGYTLISPAEAAALLSQNGQSGTVNPAPQRPTAIWPNTYVNLTIQPNITGLSPSSIEVGVTKVNNLKARIYLNALDVATTGAFFAGKFVNGSTMMAKRYVCANTNTEDIIVSHIERAVEDKLNDLGLLPSNIGEITFRANEDTDELADDYGVNNVYSEL